MEANVLLVKYLSDTACALALKCRRLRALADGYRAKLPTAEERAVLDAAREHAAAYRAMRLAYIENARLHESARAAFLDGSLGPACIRSDDSFDKMLNAVRKLGGTL